MLAHLNYEWETHLDDQDVVYGRSQGPSLGEDVTSQQQNVCNIQL